MSPHIPTEEKAEALHLNQTFLGKCKDMPSSSFVNHPAACSPHDSVTL